MAIDKETKLEQFRYVKDKINGEGFHYCFVNYSSFSEIKDKKFHELREKYIEASKDLERYIDKTINEEENIVNIKEL